MFAVGQQKDGELQRKRAKLSEIENAGKIHAFPSTISNYASIKFQLRVLVSVELFQLRLRMSDININYKAHGGY